MNEWEDVMSCHLSCTCQSPRLPSPKSLLEQAALAPHLASLNKREGVYDQEGQRKERTEAGEGDLSVQSEKDTRSVSSRVPASKIHNLLTFS